MHQQQVTLLFQQNSAQQKIIDLLTSSIDENAKKNAALVEDLTSSLKKLEVQNLELNDKIGVLEAAHEADEATKIVYSCTNGHPFKRSTDHPYGPTSTVRCDNCKKTIGNKQGCIMFHHCHICSQDYCEEGCIQTMKKHVPA